ncbi:hypothetical protein N7495_006646 [Penicillium taxi]|uniref:uncharacterized protein n=1 Tax=Penicillium taxi TaxID=168475 RepID=UPI002545BB4D|nr:uncharacterized protein N7495_006646 [Penicillium taxi]KAJ5894955.1 hypothetical protein N7495_006646 [Penicillium taxi]
MVRPRHYQFLTAAATIAFGLWFLTSRLRVLQIDWGKHSGIDLFDGSLPPVPNYDPENEAELYDTDPTEPESGYQATTTENELVKAPSPTSALEWNSGWDDQEPWPEWSQTTTTTSSESPQPTTHVSQEELEKYLHAILDYKDTSFEQVPCPVNIGNRYKELQATASGNGQIRYFFALDLYQSAAIIPRLFSSIIEAIRFLGPEHCAISIVEGRSEDGTYEILAALKSRVEVMGAHVFLSTSTINPLNGKLNRIEALSKLRNKALDPLKAQGPSGLMPELADMYSPEAVIIFINDIALCPEDILELVFQHVNQEAHMTCAFDWIFNGTLFYDSWVSRSLVGNTFFEVPHDGSWDYSKDMFFDDPESKSRYEAFQPVQVYSCWGGMVTLDAVSFAEDTIKFRSSEEGECYMGEPTLLGKDLYRLKLGKILAIPSVNVAYSDKEAVGTKYVRGHVSDHVNVTMSVMHKEEKVKWKVAPPGMVKCLPNFNQPSWSESI